MPKTAKSLVGKVAPSFALRDQEGKLVRLRDFRGKKVLLYFYVRDDTPGCTKEACSFRDGSSQLKMKNTVVLGVSPDPAEMHKRFASKYGLTFPLLVDDRAEVAKKYGVWGKKSMYGRTFFGIIRSTFLIDESGRVQKEYRRVKVDDHLEHVLRDLA
jgi:peroxiredoxin Q/BCP